MTNKADRLEKLMVEMLGIYKAKNKDYGDSFSESFEEFGLIAPVVRMNDKMNRIKNLTQSEGRQVKGESLRDSLMDLANYAMMTVIELDQQVEDWKEENRKKLIKEKMRLSPILDSKQSEMDKLRDAVKELERKGAKEQEYKFIVNKESDYEAGRQENL